MSRFPYHTQAVRDLAWACFSPGLLHSWEMADDGQNVADCGLSLTPARAHWLNELDRKPSALLEHLASKPGKRLGIYFERLWHFFLEQDPDTELVAHNLAVRDHGRTLGEFDIIYWCHQRQRHCHLELAVKFYLGKRQHTSVETRSHWQEWLGPNSRDKLNLKLDQLLQRQIRLGEHPVARECLAALGVFDPVPEISIKGYLFQSPLSGSAERTDQVFPASVEENSSPVFTRANRFAADAGCVAAASSPSATAPAIKPSRSRKEFMATSLYRTTTSLICVL